MTLMADYVARDPRADLTTRDAFERDVLVGLARPVKQLLPKYFYDATGSVLFEEITELDEYYPTRAEMEILREQGPALTAFLPARPAIVEFGGASARKFRLLLDAFRDVAAYIPVDIAPDLMLSEARSLRREYPCLELHPIAADFTKPFEIPLLARTGTIVGFFPGSTIGNFEPDEAVNFLRRAAQTLGNGSTLMVGVDLIKNREMLERAYCDHAGVTAAFNLNLLRRINRELGADFDLNLFEHRAVYNEERQRIEMHLESVAAQTVRVAGESFSFHAGERIHTENSYKYTVEGFQTLAQKAGWSATCALLDRNRLFSVHILQLQPRN